MKIYMLYNIRDKLWLEKIKIRKLVYERTLDFPQSNCFLGCYSLQRFKQI